MVGTTQTLTFGIDWFLKFHQIVNDLQLERERLSFNFDFFISLIILFEA
jgi:hypothetical protein